MTTNIQMLFNITNMSIVLKEIRRKYKLTQAEFAKKLDITRSAIAQIESGKNNISMPLAKKISMLFEVSIDDLINKDHAGVMRDLYQEGDEEELYSLSKSIYYQINDINLTIEQIEITKIAIKQFGEDKNLNWDFELEQLNRIEKASGFKDVLSEYKTKTKDDSLDNQFLNKVYHLSNIYRDYALQELYKIVTTHYGTLKKYDKD